MSINCSFINLIIYANIITSYTLCANNCIFMPKIDLMHVVLYAKYWYQRTNNVYDDLRLMMRLDGYHYLTMDKDVFNKLLVFYSNLVGPVDLHQFICLVEWRIPFDEDYRVRMIKVILSELCFRNFPYLERPVYKKGILPFNRKPGMTYKEMNDIVKVKFQEIDAYVNKDL